MSSLKRRHPRSSACKVDHGHGCSRPPSFDKTRSTICVDKKSRKIAPLKGFLENNVYNKNPCLLFRAPRLSLFAGRLTTSSPYILSPYYCALLFTSPIPLLPACLRQLDVAKVLGCLAATLITSPSPSPYIPCSCGPRRMVLLEGSRRPPAKSRHAPFSTASAAPGPRSYLLTRFC